MYPKTPVAMSLNFSFNIGKGVTNAMHNAASMASNVMNVGATLETMNVKVHAQTELPSYKAGEVKILFKKSF